MRNELKSQQSWPDREISVIATTTADRKNLTFRLLQPGKLSRKQLTHPLGTHKPEAFLALWLLPQMPAEKNQDQGQDMNGELMASMSTLDSIPALPGPLKAAWWCLASP